MLSELKEEAFMQRLRGIFAVGRADDWAGKTAECQGTADNVEAWTAERDGGRRDAGYSGRQGVPRVPRSRNGSGARTLRSRRRTGTERKRWIAAEGGAQPIPDRGGRSDGDRHILCGVGSVGECRPAIVRRKHEKN